jgi:hypothetical protein
VYPKRTAVAVSFIVWLGDGVTSEPVTGEKNITKAIQWKREDEKPSRHNGIHPECDLAVADDSPDEITSYAGTKDAKSKRDGEVTQESSKVCTPEEKHNTGNNLEERIGLPDGRLSAIVLPLRLAHGVEEETEQHPEQKSNGESPNAHVA